MEQLKLKKDQAFVNGKKISVLLQKKKSSHHVWVDVDVVAECTGFSQLKKQLTSIIIGGAKK
jgi:glyceraldehyde-3-phosphate dehydrogenase/erythrose-4-phosphate dehydrogenase